MEGDAVRSHVVHDFRAVAFAALAAAACGLVIIGCASTDATSAASAAGSASAGSASAPAGSASAGGACGTAQLKISLTHTGALAGQAGGYLTFTNDSSTSCTMSGWPAVTALTAAGRAVSLRHLRSSMFGAWQYSSPPPTTTLRPGDSGYAIVAAADKPAGSSTSCPAPYVRLRVSPPGGSGSVTISAYLPGATSYLPSCTAANGASTAGTSTVTTLSHLPH
jgi:hypothetical protein